VLLALRSIDGNPHTHSKHSNVDCRMLWHASATYFVRLKDAAACHAVCCSAVLLLTCKAHAHVGVCCCAARRLVVGKRSKRGDLQQQQQQQGCIRQCLKLCMTDHRVLDSTTNHQQYQQLFPQGLRCASMRLRCCCCTHKLQP
jgi:hypothetical protein